MPLRLMILGGGSSQIAAFHRARREGFFTILADHNPDAPARVLADAFAPASTFDVEAVTAAARDHRADALLAIGTDQPVLTAARVSATLNLPFPLSPEQARLLTNKAPMKRRFAAAGIPSAPCALLGADETRWDADGLAALTPPWVAKPVDSQGQRGIAVVHSREQLLAHRPHLLSHSREDLILVEEYYPSREVTVSGLGGRGGDAGNLDDHRPGDLCRREPYRRLRRSPLSESSHPGGRKPGGDLPRGTGRQRGLCGGGSRPHPSRRRRLRAGRRPDLLSDAPRGAGVLVNEIAFRLGGAYEDQSIPLVTGIDILDGNSTRSGQRQGRERTRRSRRAIDASRPVPARIRHRTRPRDASRYPSCSAAPGRSPRSRGIRRCALPLESGRASFSSRREQRSVPWRTRPSASPTRCSTVPTRRRSTAWWTPSSTPSASSAPMGETCSSIPDRRPNC
jgi:hypothetical protein